MYSLSAGNKNIPSKSNSLKQLARVFNLCSTGFLLLITITFSLFTIQLPPRKSPFPFSIFISSFSASKWNSASRSLFFIYNKSLYFLLPSQLTKSFTFSDLSLGTMRVASSVFTTTKSFKPITAVKRPVD